MGSDDLMVSIIIVNFNNSCLLKSCITSIIEKTKDVDYEIIVFDNSSTDDSVNIVKKYFKNVKVIESKYNLGFGMANNIAAKQAKGDIYFFLNNDTILENNAVKILSDFMVSRPNCGICGGNLYDFNANPLHSYGLKFQTPFFEIYRFYPPLIRVVQGKHWEFNGTGRPLKVAYITGADMMIWAHLFHKVGGFDTEFFLYFEESELAYRIRKLGYTAWSVPEARIKHKKGASLQFIENSRQTVFRSKYLYLKKIYGLPGMLISRMIYTIYCLIKMYYFLLVKDFNKYKRYKVYFNYDKEAFIKVMNRRNKKEND